MNRDWWILDALARIVAVIVLPWAYWVSTKVSSHAEVLATRGPAIEFSQIWMQQASGFKATMEAVQRSVDKNTAVIESQVELNEEILRFIQRKHPEERVR